MSAKGTLYILSAPSGGGKSSLIAGLLERFNLDDKLRLSISHTTRDMRPGEVDGQSYFFVNEEEFKALIERGAFLEYAQVFDRYYGTSREVVQQWLDEGRDVLLDIDWQGARNIRAQMPGCVSIFIVPPSLEELRHRLEKRQRDTPEVIDQRMELAKREISHYREYDYVVVNDKYDNALVQLRGIILARRCLLEKQEEARHELFENLLAGYVDPESSSEA